MFNGTLAPYVKPRPPKEKKGENKKLKSNQKSLFTPQKSLKIQKIKYFLTFAELSEIGQNKYFIIENWFNISLTEKGGAVLKCFMEAESYSYIFLKSLFILLMLVEHGGPEGRTKEINGKKNNNRK